MNLAGLAVPKTFQVAAILLAVAAVALADVLLKKATAQGNLEAALRSPWLWGALGLYLVQIGLFTLAFLAGWKLSLLGGLQTALYALIVLGAGVLLYHEDLTRTQATGLALALAGVLLINWQN
jgi:drug/metabolite transporter (DMT)-like permease